MAKKCNFSETWFWKNDSLFESIGLPILQPVMGCSEVVKKKIVDRQDTVIMPNLVLGQIPRYLWTVLKCFRKNSLKGRKISISKEIDTFLGQEKLKMAASTIFSIQKMEKIDNDLFRYLTSEYQDYI